MIPTTRWLLLAALLAADVTGAAPGRNTYLVELLVVENTIPDNRSELWTRNYPLPNVADSIDFGQPGLATTPVAPAGGPEGDPVIPRLAPPGARRLSPAAERLAASSSFRVLYSEAWVQDITPKSSSHAVRVHPLTTDPRAMARVDGTARLYRSRFLQMDLDLVYQGPDDLPVASGAVPGGYRYRLTEHRRIKPNEVHYFDHPRFGVLFVMTPMDTGTR